jgi:2-dehydro-3-deoxyphosphogluconate aldolase / (4S)-4-hydroxy-2-oxoglutarate aldolase
MTRLTVRPDPYDDGQSKPAGLGRENMPESRMLNTGVLAIVRLRRHQPDDALFDALAAGGVDSIEVTLPTPGSLDAVRRWVGRAAPAVGVGTVRTAQDAAAALDAGAQFVVTPTTVSEVLDVCASRPAPVVCGALTPTEVDAAWRYGATAVKVFPAETVGGPAYLRSLREPLDDVPLLPTGGVDVASTREYALVGCVGVGVGGALVAESLVADQAWSELETRARRFVAAWHEGLAEREGSGE